MVEGEHAILIDAIGEGEQTVRVGDPTVEFLRNELPPSLDHKSLQGEARAIFKVLSAQRDGNESSYTPKHVSIGPYHYGNDKLKEMQGVKFKYLADLVHRSPLNSLEKYVDVVRNNAEEAKRHYSAGVGVEHEEFVRMMVLDGCFIIEFLIKLYLNDRSSQIYDLQSKLPSLQTDLLLVENQIPFIILDALFNVSNIPEFTTMQEEDTYKGINCITLIELALVYFTSDRRGAYVAARTFNNANAHPLHLLHLFHSSLDPEYHKNLHGRLNFNFSLRQIFGTTLSVFHIFVAFRFPILCCCSFVRWIVKIISFPFALLRWFALKTCWCIKKIRCCIKNIWWFLEKLMITGGRRRWLSRIPNARYLRETGFKFRKKEATPYFLGITRRGKTIKIPVLSIQETTLILFQNLLAFEQSSPGVYGNRFTAFATFMDYLIDTEEDVAILRECGIINNRLVGDAKVASFFNNLCKGVYFEHNNHYLAPIFAYVTEYYTINYYQVKFYQWRKKFIPDYFTNPWAVPSMIVAFILLVLAVSQTFYTIYPYYHPWSQ